MTCTSKHSRSGFAMMMVLAAVAIAAVLSFALLAGATLQTRTRGNASRSVSAEYLAESGLNLAMYYLQNPNSAPSLNASNYWAGTSSPVTIGNGTVSVTVTRDAAAGNNWTYEITSTATVGSSGDTQMIRTAYARAYVKNEYRVNYTSGFNASATIQPYTVITGDVICNGTFKLSNSTSTVSGAVYAPTIQLGVGATSPSGGRKDIPTAAVGAPTTTDVNKYQTYTSGGVTYNAGTQAAGTLTGSAGVTTLGSSGSNPAGVWYCSGNLTLGDNVKIDGTLVVAGNLTVAGANIIVTPKSNYPGVVVIGNLQVNQTQKSMTVNGICFVGGQLKSSGVFVTLATCSSLTVNGGLLIGGSSPISSSYNPITNVTLNSTMNKAPELSTAGRTPIGIQVLRWGPVVPVPY
jgi:Tfp pilus assembly protein PilV/cytoskeletal protein CcmA (bactofilin family)